MNSIHPFRLLIKALILFGVFNFVYAVVDPPIGNLSIYNWLVKGRTRFPFARTTASQEVAHNIQIYENLDAMFRSTVVADKAESAEYRVFFLGDSSLWGFELAPQNTLTEQINRLGLQSCDGRPIRAYNLGYPLPSGLRDVILLD